MKKKYAHYIEIPQTLQTIIEELNIIGLQSLIVGGAVRDSLLGVEPKDIDVEVYNTDYDTLLVILDKYGPTNLVGKSFGIITVTDSEGNSYDFSLPRRDSKVSEDSTGQGRGFVSEFDSDITPEEAASRRDYTMNALAYNPISGEVLDFFGGVEDLQNGILRATSPAFVEDPLRVLRGMQFAARFNMSVDADTAEMARTLKDTPLVKERISGEWLKLFSKGSYPSKGMEFLIDTGWIENYPQLNALIGVEQDPIHHPEGDAFTHTLFAMDAAAQIADENGLPENQRVELVAGALVHDLGKAVSTNQDEEGNWRSPGHAQSGVAIANEFLTAIHMPKDRVKNILPLVEHHMDHISYTGNDIEKTVKNLSRKIYPATIGQLYNVLQSDIGGRTSGKEISPTVQQYYDYAKNEGYWENRASELINGSDIISVFPHVRKDATLGEALNTANQMFYDHKIQTKEEAVEAALSVLKKKQLLVNGNDVMEILNIPGGPDVGFYLDEVWEKQLTGEVTDKNQAIAYLNSFSNEDAEDSVDVPILAKLIKNIKLGGFMENTKVADTIDWETILKVKKDGEDMPLEDVPSDIFSKIVEEIAKGFNWGKIETDDTEFSFARAEAEYSKIASIDDLGK